MTFFVTCRVTSARLFCLKIETFVKNCQKWILSGGDRIMPTYAYRCHSCGAEIEIVQKMSDEPLKICESCGGKLQKLMFPVGIVFKGSGFYVNDYAKKRGAASSTTAAAPAATSISSTSTDAAPKVSEKSPASPSATKMESTPVAASAKA
jgi:putative FmdB family regulatory protein